MPDRTEKKSQAPWLVGIIDTLVGARLIQQSSIPHRNRLAVILLDSAFETACRSFLRYRAKIQLTDAHKHRDNLVKTIKAKLQDIDQEVWDSIDFYYQDIRCDFYHQSAGKTITDDALQNYEETVEFLIDRAFGISCAPIAGNQLKSLQQPAEAGTAVTAMPGTSLLSKLNDRAHKVLVAVDALSPSSVKDVNEFFRREGESLRLKTDEFTNIVARNSGSKRLFYHNKDFERWELSGLGRFKLKQIQQEINNA